MYWKKLFGAASAITLLATLGGSVVGTNRAYADRAAPTGKDGKTPASQTTLAPTGITLALKGIVNVLQTVAAVERPGDDLLYLVQKTGKVLKVNGATIDSKPLVDVSERIDTTNERGLLGLAFSPKRKEYIYLDYVLKNGHVIVSEIAFDQQTKLADLSKERILLDIPKPFNEHNAGTLSFDPEGNLYVAIGDGGGTGDKFNNAQNLTKLLGKILRINPEPSKSSPYTIPKDNPFANGLMETKTKRSKAAPEVLAYGLRNPWNTSIDSQTGDVWVPDVGQNTAEEVNIMPKGKWGQNFGWSLREGAVAFKGAKPVDAVDPVYAYPHLDGRCAVAGGFVYRGKAVPGLVGKYIFGDVCTGQISALTKVASGYKPESLGLRVPYLVAFGQTNDHELLVISFEGQISQIMPK